MKQEFKYNLEKENIKEILNRMLDFFGSKHISRVITSKKNKELYEKIKKETDFLDEDTKVIERVYCIINDIKEPVLCYECKKNRVKFKWFWKGWYSKFCSNKCSTKNQETQAKQKKTNIERYWVENPNQLEEIKKKKEETLLRNHGVSSYKELYKKKEYQEKRDNTSLELYGVKFYDINKLKEVRDKIKQTLLEKYWTTDYLNSEENRKKIIKELNEKYNTKIKLINEIFSIPEIKEKRDKNFKKTINKKYDVDHPSQNEDIKEKKKETTKKNHGVEYPYQNKEILEKARNNTYNKHWYYSALEDENKKREFEKQNEIKFW